MTALPGLASADDEEEDEGLQQRLTEREDKRRPLEPFSVPFYGRPLILGGEYEFGLEGIRPIVLDPEVDGRPVREPNQLRMGHELQLEAFYSFGEPLSLFVQFQGIWEQDLFRDSFDYVSDTYLERGEMWLYSEDILGSDVSIDLGRLNFEDDRRWWWDDELDAARAIWEGESAELAVAIAYELGSDRSDQSYVDPDQERVLRWIAEFSWDFADEHSFQLFLLHQDDHSPTQQVGDFVSPDHEDDSDARLTWFGARQTGIFDLEKRGLLGYWLDTGLVEGRETFLEFGDPENGRAEVEERSSHDVRGWGFDVGMSWLPPLAFEPRLFVGYAYGSGDATAGGDDRSYRQTGLQANEAGFGGVELFPSYGLLLQPELSNLHVVTVGAGISLLRSSSLDLVYHHYRQDDASDELLDSFIEAELTGRSKRLGWGVDLVLAVEEWERFEFDVAAAVLRTGSAFEHKAHDWVVGGFVAVRYAF
jgi:alginate production protein